jgi:hypothetical protein
LGTAFRIVRPGGRIEYTDTPSGAGAIDAITPGGRKPVEQGSSAENSYQQAKGAIKETQKRIPKLVDYLNYLGYLRHNNPIRFDRVMRELRDSDPQTWLKLQKYPQFRPLRETAVGVKAGTNLMGAGVGLATGNITGSIEKWMENTLKDLMKRDRWGPYADVLGARTSTMPAPPAPSYSNTRLGQHLKVEDARLSQAAKEVARDLQKSRAAIRGGLASSISRVGGTALDVLVAFSDASKAEDLGVAALNLRARKMYEAGIIDESQWAEALSMLSQGRRAEMIQFLDAQVKRWLKQP